MEKAGVIHTKPPFRAEHVGSLPRPERLMAAREQYAVGKLSKADLTQIEDESIRKAVAMQERVAIGTITDGEYRKRGMARVPVRQVRGLWTGDRGARVSHSAV